MKIKEKIIEENLALHYGSFNYEVKKQVFLSQKRIDIILIDRSTREISAIEVKIYDWKTALRQANLNKIACNKSYVAIWHEFSHRAMDNKESFERLGIGLIVIDGSFTPKIEVSPRESDFSNPLACNYILATA